MPVPPIPGYVSLKKNLCGSANNLDPAAIIRGLQAATNDQKLQLANLLTGIGLPDDGFLNVLLGAMTEPQRCSILESLFLAGSQMCCQVMIDSRVESSFCEWIAGPFSDPRCCVGLLITLGADVTSGGFSGSIYGLGIPRCDQQAQFIDIPDVAVPDLITGKNAHLGDGFQAIINLISQLNYNLTNFCKVTSVWTPAFPAATDDVYTFRFGTVPGALRLDIVANPNPARINWSPPEATPFGGVQRFGKYIWIRPDGTNSGVYFHNVNEQVVVPPDAECTTFVYYANPDVQPIFYQTKYWGWPGNTYPYVGQIHPVLP